MPFNGPSVHRLIIVRLEEPAGTRSPSSAAWTAAEAEPYTEEMKSQIKLLTLVVRATVILLTAGAVLVVLGVFNDFLDWDIFGPAMERLRRGVFASCLALGGFGAAISV